MKIAYLISAYRDPEQLKNLVDALDECADFYIHIDKKVSEKPFHDVLARRSNVFFTPKRFYVQWGGYSQVLYQQELLRCSVNSNIPYQRFVCLSGMDYPLFSNERIRREFTQNASREYICGMCKRRLKSAPGGGAV